jgi:hypothetical protein
VLSVQEAVLSLLAAAHQEGDSYKLALARGGLLVVPEAGNSPN